MMILAILKQSDSRPSKFDPLDFEANLLNGNLKKGRSEYTSSTDSMPLLTRINCGIRIVIF